MNLGNANTEPFYRFHRFHEEFSRNMRIAFGALEALRESSRSDPASTQKLVALPTGGEPWGVVTKWRDISGAISDSARFLSQIALVRVVSAFEDFLVNVEAEHERHLRRLDPKYQSAPQREMSETSRMESVCKRLGGDARPLAPLLPIFRYFVGARNCIAHRSGRASEELISITHEPEFQAAVAEYRTRRGAKLPAFPELDLHREIKFLPRHSILASDVFYRAAQHINALLLSNLGADGMVYMAAHHGLLSDDRVSSEAYRSPTHIVNYMLYSRYRVTDGDFNESTAVLKSMNKWDHCRRRYRQLFPTVAEE
ncbi:MAG TPA: hypothetical protein VLT36_06950 [Candidatus Dormibacteraeota bacterium]|nr:hypothetical protein [Candidatus Dormibacteraeota bacterium]